MLWLAAGCAAQPAANHNADFEDPSWTNQKRVFNEPVVNRQVFASYFHWKNKKNIGPTYMTYFWY